MADLKESLCDLTTYLYLTIITEREQRDHKRVVEKKKEWLGGCGNSQPFSLGDVVNQQTHFTCNEDPTRAALVISTTQFNK